MKIYAYHFYKTSNRTKANESSSLMGDLRMRGTYENETNGIFVLRLKMSPVISHWLWKFSPVSGSGPLEVLPSPLPSSWCPLVHPNLLRLFLSFSKAPFLCHLFGASIWPLSPVASAWASSFPKTRLHPSAPSSHPLHSLCFQKMGCHELPVPDWGTAPAHEQTRGMHSYPHFRHFSNWKHPEESSLPLSTSKAELLSI